MQFWLIQAVNGVAYGMLLFLLAAGLSVVLGMMGVANLAHGAFYLIASYLAYSVADRTGSFLLAVAAGMAMGALAGVFSERLFMRRLVGRVHEQVLLTIGVAFVLADLSLVIWHGDPLTVRAPEALRGSVRLGPTLFPVYRLFIVAVGALMALGMELVVERTQVGAVIRATVDNQEMARAMGIEVEKVFMATFAFGSMLAGLAGAIGLPFLSVYPGLDWELLPLALVVVVVGGVGSIRGALAGSLILGLIDNFGRALFPDLSYFTLFIPMAIILALRPQGLIPRR